ncbi:MAG TPA: peptidase S1, partial [Acidobacteriaceae bacterium]
MTTPSESPREPFARLRARRLTLTFAVLATLSAGILIGSVLTRTVSGKEQVDSTDARPLTIPAPVTLSNEFSKISKAISPAVVNINTVTIPKPSANR